MGRWSRRLWILPPVVLGVAVVLYAQAVKSPPKKAEVVERAVKARAIKLTRMEVVPRAVGYGSTRPGRSWNAVAEVAGQVSWISDQLKDGALVRQGTELLRLDDSSQRLTLRQIEAQLNASHIKDRSTQASLTIEERGLALLVADLENKRKLSQRGAIAETTVDAVQQQVYAAEAKVQNLKNTLGINAAEREVLEAQKAMAEFDLSRTLFAAPFDVRITEVKVDRAQFANKGQPLFSSDGMDVAEIDARFPIGHLKPLISSRDEGSESPGKVPGAMGLEVRVRLKTSSHDLEWEGRVDRVSALVDPQTQSIGVVVAVDAPYEKSSPGKRPPLTRNTFVEVELIGAPQKGMLAVPASAVHEGRIYVLNEENRLEIRPVRLKYTLGDYAVVDRGVEQGERILVSDLIPAVEGMLIEPQEDKKSRKKLVAAVTGKEPEK